MNSLKEVCDWAWKEAPEIFSRVEEHHHRNWRMGKDAYTIHLSLC